MDSLTLLNQLGLNLKQAKVYIKALELGRFSILDISRATGLKRPTCYVIIEELMDQGLISIIPGPKKKLFTAQHPESLLRRARENYRLAEELLPQLQNIMQTIADKPVLKVFVGQEGLHNIYEDMLKNNSEKTIYYIAAVKDLVASVGQDYLKDWISRRIAKKIKTISIRIKSKELKDESFVDTSDSLREIYYAPQGFYIPYSIYLYCNKVAFVSTEKDMFGFTMESVDFVKTIKTFFNTIKKLSTLHGK